VVNRKWFQSLPADLQKAVDEAGAAVDKASFEFASATIARANDGWTKNGGQLLKLPAPEQAKMMADLRKLGGELLSKNPVVQAEYDALVQVADRLK
jgi:TRAP-type C4-dicarboxylate transport system substrate-binding protein